MTMSDKKCRAIRKFKDLRVLVLGDVMLDIYDFCYTARSKPIPSEKPGKRAYMARPSVKALGGAGNVAANLASLGIATSLIGLTGQDGQAFTLQQLTDGLGITSHLIPDTSRPTTTKTRLYVDDEYLLRRDEEATDQIHPGLTRKILRALRRTLDTSPSAVILSDYDKGFFTHELAQEIIAACRVRGLPVIVDFKPPNTAYFAGADIVVPNDAEADVLWPGFLHSTHLEREVRALYQLLSCHNLVVTLGPRGICGFDGQAFFLAPPHPVDAVDAVGCGDTVRVGLALGYVSGLSLPEAASLANDAAAVVLQKLGTATLTPQELLDFIAKTAY